MSVRLLENPLDDPFENFEVGTAVSAILSCENAKQVQGGTVRGKRRYD